MKLGRALVLRVDDVDAARAEAGQHQEAALLPFRAVTGAAGVPPGVVQLVAHVWHLKPVDHLRVGGRGWVDVHRRQVVGRLYPGAHTQRSRVEDLLSRPVHRFARRGVARPTGVAQARRVVVR